MEFPGRNEVRPYTHFLLPDEFVKFREGPLHEPNGRK